MVDATDFSRYAALRLDAQTPDQRALREVAEQFEALFVQQMLKSMRDASFGDPLFPDSGGQKVYRDMLDQQLALDTTQRGGIGLADLIVRQMQQTGAVDAPQPASEPVLAPEWSSPRDFVADILPHARRAGAALGVSPLALVAQAALETGWGKRLPQTSEGQSSLNVFGIKTGGNWDGPSGVHRTLEFRDGVARSESARFRAYPDLAGTFSDYADLIGSGARYRNAPGAGDDIAGFAHALQRAGYATDPEYAEKLARVAGSDTMRDALASLKESDLLSLARQQTGGEDAGRIASTLGDR